MAGTEVAQCVAKWVRNFTKNSLTTTNNVIIIVIIIMIKFIYLC